MRALSKTQTVDDIVEYYSKKYAGADVDLLQHNEVVKSEIQADLDSMYEMLERLGTYPLPKATTLEEAWLLETGVAKRGKDGCLYFDVETTSKTADLWKLNTDTAFELCNNDVDSARVKQSKEVQELNEMKSKDAEEMRTHLKEMMAFMKSRR